MWTTLNYRKNRDLFSNYYLDEHLPETDDWNVADEAEVRAAHEEIRDRYRQESGLAAEYGERQLRETLVGPVFETLGLKTAVGQPVRGGPLRPDYTLFGSERAREDAFQRRRDGRSFHANALAVAEVKRWGQSLDGGSDRDFADPSYRIHAYIDATGLDRGILTNGQKWRLYYGPTGHRFDSYYEIDLPKLLATDEPEEFKYFYLFFRREAFVGETAGRNVEAVSASRLDTDRPFVERVHRKSNVFAEELSEDLRENVYEALSLLAQGFVESARKDSAGDRGEDSAEHRGENSAAEPGRDSLACDLETVYEASLTYLYRLIFVLYAESDGRNLLDTDNEVYRRRYSLNALKRRVAAELDSPNPVYRSWQTTLWDRLDDLFALVNRGSRAQGIPADDFYVPAYDGGLFESGADSGEIGAFLDSHAVGDAYLARVVELLTRRDSAREDEGWVFVDYSSLDVRHLGSIYEGLLEYELEIADAPVAAVREDGEQEWVSADAADPAETVARVEPGDAYLTTETGKRKTTGSYYTPEFVVEYVVGRTLEPLLDEIRADLDPADPDYAEAFAERVFDLAVLDPAMGSGHFLVETVEYLARAVVEAQQVQVERDDREGADREGAERTNAESVGDVRDVHRARRQVAKQCIYGVDQNGMAVELAKMSLWLRTLAAEQPLAFLDHRLVQGDSLAGTDVTEIEESTFGTGSNAALTEFGPNRTDAIGDLMDAQREFAVSESETLADVKEMKRKYAELQRDDLGRQLTAMANVHTAERFGLDVPSGAYERMGRALDDARAWAEVAEESWFEEAQRMADDREFFHWKLAFPEVFVDEEAPPKTGTEAKFDAVIGNPPYVRSRNLSDDRKEYYREEFRTAQGSYDLYVPFVELAVDLGRRVSLVVPNKWTTTDYGRELRNSLLDDWGLREVLDVSNLDVFPDANVYPVVVTLGEERSDDFDREILVRHPDDERALNAARTTAVSRSLVDRLGGRVVPLDLDPEFADVASDVLARCDRLADHATLTEGVHTGNVREELLTDDPDAAAEDAPCRKIVDGTSVERYHLDWDGRWIRYDESLVERQNGDYADLRRPDCFEGEKLLVRDISDRPVAVYDDEDHYALNTLYSVELREDSDLSLRYLLGVFNSAFVATYFRQVYGGTHVSGDYLRFKPMFAERIPVPDPDGAPIEASEVAEIAAHAGVEGVPEHSENALETSTDPEEIVAALTRRLREIRDERAALRLDVLDYLGDIAEQVTKESGLALGEAGVPASGVGDSILAETTTDREGLRIGNVQVRREDDGGDSSDSDDSENRNLVLTTTARYKPDDDGRDDRETDEWGYAETDPIPALRFRDLRETERALVETWVPAAVERAEGFAGFRRYATKTNSPMDRLRALALPDPETVADEVERYREVRTRANYLDERIATLEEAIDEIVYRLYGLDDDEVEVVRTARRTD
ncbi:Eco57I restriction-modification methylase domain-containing protein [Halorussus salinisoli]|uniref:Eco57I restriction-modification methylase domain-containing protein n=1 Tax=Halorussus salinisoli TaxID=2558242 RepID=UPI0010C1D863|nr:TaqI-like C-terminal specificity domain-containing protein [Halorussus salinisoli]